MIATTDIEEILLQAQYRWLRPAEICQILTNYNSFQISSQPSYMPPSMILILILISKLFFFSLSSRMFY